MGRGGFWNAKTIGGPSSVSIILKRNVLTFLWNEDDFQMIFNVVPMLQFIFSKTGLSVIVYFSVDNIG